MPKVEPRYSWSTDRLATLQCLTDDPTRETSMLTRIAWISLFTAMLMISTIVARAQGAQHGQDFLTPAQAVQALVDGRPWAGLTTDGKRATITLNKDGTGSFQGPMPMALSTSWTIKGQDFCIKISIAGTKCLRFRRVAGGFQGWRGNEVDLKLVR